MKQFASFGSLKVGTEFRLAFSSLTFIKAGRFTAKAYNSFDEYVGRDSFRLSDIVEPQF